MKKLAGCFIVAALTCGLAACSSSGKTDTAAKTTSASTAGPTSTTAAAASTTAYTGKKLNVAAAFYPLAYITEAVGGDRVTVSTLVKPGVEPHDLELSAKDTVELTQRDAIVMLSGKFQPAVEKATASANLKAKTIDVLPAAKLQKLEPAHIEGVTEEEHGHGDEGPDPHFWTDPTKMADVADAVATSLGQLDAANAAAYTANAAKFRQEMTTLDTEFKTGLNTCQSKKLVTNHAAFGYLAGRYGLAMTSISGLQPNAEPKPKKLAALTNYIKAESIPAVYYETLVSPAVAQTLAKSAGVQALRLDPVEGITGESAGTDYAAIMRDNLKNLRTGLKCQ